MDDQVAGRDSFSPTGDERRARQALELTEPVLLQEDYRLAVLIVIPVRSTAVAYSIMGEATGPVGATKTIPDDYYQRTGGYITEVLGGAPLEQADEDPAHPVHGIHGIVPMLDLSEGRPALPLEHVVYREGCLHPDDLAVPAGSYIAGYEFLVGPLRRGFIERAQATSCSAWR